MRTNEANRRMDVQVGLVGTQINYFWIKCFSYEQKITGVFATGISIFKRVDFLELKSI